MSFFTGQMPSCHCEPYLSFLSGHWASVHHLILAGTHFPCFPCCCR